jgi:hypothetical protein
MSASTLQTFTLYLLRNQVFVEVKMFQELVLLNAVISNIPKEGSRLLC